MNDGFKILIGAIFAIILIGCIVMIFAQPHTNVEDANNTTIMENIQDRVNQVQESSVGSTDQNQQVQNQNQQVQNQSQNANYNNGNGNQTTYQSNGQYQGQNSGSQNQYSSNGVTGGKVENNYQAGHGSYYQIDYKDGNFRQYDTKTGELVGSTFEEDQAKLGMTGSGDLE